MAKFFAAIILLLLAVFTVFVSFHAFKIVQAVIEGAKELEPSIYVPLTVTVGSAILGLAATLYTQSRVRKREIEAAHRERKIEIYLEFLQSLERVILSVKTDLGSTPLDQNELVKDLIEFRTKAVLWASPEVLKAVGDMTHHGNKGAIAMFDVLERLQREMRKDIGLSNWGLEKDFFSRFYLSNPDDLSKLRNEGAKN